MFSWRLDLFYLALSFMLESHLSSHMWTIPLMAEPSSHLLSPPYFLPRGYPLGSFPHLPDPTPRHAFPASIPSSPRTTLYQAILQASPVWQLSTARQNAWVQPDHYLTTAFKHPSLSFSKFPPLKASKSSMSKVKVIPWPHNFQIDLHPGAYWKSQIL